MKHSRHYWRPDLGQQTDRMNHKFSDVELSRFIKIRESKCGRESSLKKGLCVLAVLMLGAIITAPAYAQPAGLATGPARRHSVGATSVPRRFL